MAYLTSDRATCEAYADSYGELADQAAKAAFAKQFQRDRAKLAAMGIAIESSSRNIPPSQKGRISLPTVCSLAMSRACVCCSATRICRFLPLRITLRAPCRFPRLLRTNPSTLPVPRRACRRRRFQDLAWIPSRRVLARNPFPTSWSSVDQRRFAATVDVDGEHLNVAYADSDDLAMFVLSHPGASIVSPQEAVDAFNRRLHAATQFVPADESTGTDSSTVVSPEINRNSTDEDDTEEGKGRPKKNSAFQTGSEVDRRLRLMLFLSAHMVRNTLLKNLRNDSSAGRSPMTN